MSPGKPKNTRPMRLARRIIGIIAAGFKLSDQAWHFISTTAPKPDPDGLKALLKPPYSDDSEPVVQLLFYPDEQMQIELEVSLAREPVSEDDQRCLIACLERQKLPTTIYMPQIDQGFETLFPADLVPEFVARLCLTKTLDPDLAETIAAHLPEPLGLTVRVRLRNAPARLSKPHLAFLKKVFACLPADTRDYLGCVDFLLDFLAACPRSEPVEAHIRTHYLKYYQQLKAAIAFEARMLQSNPETLFAQGVRQPYLDKAKIRNQITRIEQILFALGLDVPYPPESAYAATVRRG